MLVILRDTCTDSTAKPFRACFYMEIANVSINMLLNGLPPRYVCVMKVRRRGIAPFGEMLGPLRRYRAMRSIAAIVSHHRAAQSSSDQIFEAAWGHAHPRFRVMEVCTEIHIFQCFKAVTEVLARDVCVNDPWISVPKTSFYWVP